MLMQGKKLSSFLLESAHNCMTNLLYVNLEIKVQKIKTSDFFMKFAALSANQVKMSLASFSVYEISF